MEHHTALALKCRNRMDACLTDHEEKDSLDFLTSNLGCYLGITSRGTRQYFCHVKSSRFNITSRCPRIYQLKLA